jgi:site-specific recombinase XerD
MLVLALMDSGLRESELAGLCCCDVRVGKGQRHLHVRRGKGGKQRTVVLADETRRLLVEYLDWLEHSGWSNEPDSPLFSSSRGGRLHRSAIWRIWSGALKAAGVQHHRVHDARHTFATGLYRATRDLRLVQKQLGHQSVTTTSAYADVLDEDLAAGMDRMLGKEAP